ncbi:hypothetical protein [Cellulomonas sp. Root137]|uniref:hypothetical protein n=1 Tax=Cellulomonas sp. Root137 TaxID=1736459 RepID=UPI0009E97126|nr:hypothetical protein [Cellulomonas sp. Root137]
MIGGHDAILLAGGKGCPWPVGGRVAYDPASGTEVFRSPYPAGVGNVSPINGRLVGIDTTTDGNDFSYVLLR